MLVTKSKNNKILTAETGHREEDGINTTGAATTLCPSWMIILRRTEH